MVSFGTDVHKYCDVVVVGERGALVFIIHPCQMRALVLGKTAS